MSSRGAPWKRLRRRPPQPSNPLSARIKTLLALALAWAAAFVDVMGWLVIYHVYTSHMTGNTAALGIALADHNWTQALHHAWPILPFVLGLLLGATTTAWARRMHWHSSFSIALVTEILLLVCLVWFGSRYSTGGQLTAASSAQFYFLLSLPSAAMGLQTVTVTRIAGLRVYTTYLTGSLTKFAEAVAHYTFWFYDRTHGRSWRRFYAALRVTPRQRFARHAALTGGLWAAYLAGAICGVLLKERYSLPALCFPIAILSIATIVDLVRPVAAADEPRPWDDS